VIGYGEQLGVLRARSREEAEAFIYRKREELKTRLPEGDQSILDAFHEIEADERFLAKIRLHQGTHDASFSKTGNAASDTREARSS